MARAGRAAERASSVGPRLGRVLGWSLGARGGLRLSRARHRVQYGLEVPQDHLPIARHRRSIAGSSSSRASIRERALDLAEEQFGLRPPSPPRCHGARRALARRCVRLPSGSAKPTAGCGDRLGRAERSLVDRRLRGASARAGRIDDAVRVLDVWQADAARLARDVGARARHAVSRPRRRRRVATSSARSLLAQAVAEHEAVGDPFGRARALLALGTVRRRAREKRPPAKRSKPRSRASRRSGPRPGSEGARRARTDQRAHARARADGSRAARRGPRCRGPDEPRGRRCAVPRRADGREPSEPHLRKARRPFADRARPPAPSRGTGRAKFKRSVVSTAAATS